MARNKYPEETVNRILDVSLKLFLEKGYEKTSVQDIIDHLGGLTKGAIYHHFKSKEDIMLAVMEKLYAGQDSQWMQAALRRDDGKTGAEKLRDVLRYAVSNNQVEVFKTALDMTQNPKMLALQVRSIYEESVPQLLQPIIELGMQDGSIPTRYPRELAEMILLLINLWLTPLTAYAEPQVLENRLQLFQQVMQGMGLDLLDEPTVARFRELCRVYHEQRQKL